MIGLAALPPDESQVSVVRLDTNNYINNPKATIAGYNQYHEASEALGLFNLTWIFSEACLTRSREPAYFKNGFFILTLKCALSFDTFSGCY